MRIVAAGDDSIEAIVQVLERGQPVLLPTDTVYGLAARAVDVKAVERLFAIKQRVADLSIAALVADAEQAAEHARLGEAEALVRAFWPGALTIVVEKLRGSPLIIGAADGTVGLRCPSCALVREVARRVGPLAATSANISGQAPLTSLADLDAVFGDQIPLAVDGGVIAGVASTVARMVGADLTILREGAITEAELRGELR